MRHRYVIADVFTDRPLEGNQLAVFIDASEIDEDRFQRTAREMNLSETVFVLPSEIGGDARIRIFTPRTELPFAGHPTLGSAFVLGEMRPDLDTVRLETGMGIVPVELERDASRIKFGKMEQPTPKITPYEQVDSLFTALGVTDSELPVEVYDNGPRHVYVALETEEALRRLEPDMGALARLGAIGVSCFAGSGRSWKTRMFSPGNGVPEDPATGSAAGPLAVHLARYGRILFEEEIEISQGAEINRQSYLYASVFGSPDDIERVVVGGSAVIVAEGEYRLD